VWCRRIPNQRIAKRTRIIQQHCAVLLLHRLQQQLGCSSADAASSTKKPKGYQSTAKYNTKRLLKV